MRTIPAQKGDKNREVQGQAFERECLIMFYFDASFSVRCPSKSLGIAQGNQPSPGARDIFSDQTGLSGLFLEFLFSSR
jgi:hypothetical protein